MLIGHVTLCVRWYRHSARNGTRVRADVTGRWITPSSPRRKAGEPGRVRRVPGHDHRVYATYEVIVDACCVAWSKLIAAPARIRSIATSSYAKTVNP